MKTSNIPEELRKIDELSIDKRSYKTHYPDKNDPDYKFIKYDCLTTIGGFSFDCIEKLYNHLIGSGWEEIKRDEGEFQVAVDQIDPYINIELGLKIE